MKPTIYIHHTAWAHDDPQLADVDRWHKDQGYPLSDLGHTCFYQYFIENDGEVIHTRPNMDPSVVYKPQHRNSISIVIAGDLDHEQMTDKQRSALTQLLDILKGRYDLSPWNISVHKSYEATSCPGKNFNIRSIAIDCANRWYSGVLKQAWLFVINYRYGIK